ncbi:L-dopachrome tautomerase-related protein [Colwellia sp. 1_MG-2023]|uniref:L-dopachrome tautomerase-related protein n=1 Tax=Colwellia sp. 1_MG-2023 TaxID=3062649 RepID=UPI0026E3F85D|nr:L-dopachrome tautomerase-related protein [Colwellia sp. 1_MG-2023]MDO6445425.1 L-dopachrome tautomerase-related protein [Colwellia sp. 1_MG-2023]
MKVLKRSLLSVAVGLTVIVSSPIKAVEVGELEAVTQFNDTRGGGITVTPDGRIVISMHPLDNPKYRVVEVMANGTKKPFPTVDWADGPEIGKVGLTSVIGVHTDSNGIVWILDMGSETTPAQFIAWDSVKNKLHNTIIIDQVALQPNSFIQDFAIDEKHGKIYIADMTFGNFMGATKPAIIVVDVKTGKSKRVLENTEQLMPEDIDIVIEASLLASKTKEGKTNNLRFGLNPIAIDEANNWLYFGAFSGTKIYRLPTSLIADSKTSSNKLKKSIEVFGPKNPSDGIAFAPGGGILATDLENSAIGLTTKGKYQTLIKDKKLSWPDSLAVSNGYIYVTQDQLHQHPAFSQGLGNAKAPYTLYRFKYQP